MFPNRFPPLGVLLDELGQVEFAVLVATRDDPVEIRGTRQVAMRDNVLLEFGLFAGRLGKERAHLLLPLAGDRDDPFRVPSDILGVGCSRYGSEAALDDEIARVSGELLARFASTSASGSREEGVRDWGRRLLRFVAWARGELSAVDVWSASAFRMLAGKVQGASAFLLEEVDCLGLRPEFDAVVDSLANAAETFPNGLLEGHGFVLDRERYDFHSFLPMPHPQDAAHVHERVRRAEHVFSDRWERALSQHRHAAVEWYEPRLQVVDHLQYDRSWWHRPGWHPLWRGELEPHDLKSSFTWWRLGLLEALGDVAMRMDGIREWSRGAARELQDRFTAFEARLHDRLFA